MPTPFTGTFYVVTQYSVFEVTVKDFETTPEVVKLAYTSSRAPKVVLVSQPMHKRLYWAITVCGLIACGPKGKTLSELNKPLMRAEELSKRHRGSSTRNLMGLFFKREAADRCLRRCSSRQPRMLRALQRDEDGETLEVLQAIELDHPLIRISIRNRGKKNFAIPQRLLKKLTSE